MCLSSSNLAAVISVPQCNNVLAMSTTGMGCSKLAKQTSKLPASTDICLTPSYTSDVKNAASILKQPTMAIFMTTMKVYHQILLKYYNLMHCNVKKQRQHK